MHCGEQLNALLDNTRFGVVGDVHGVIDHAADAVIQLHRLGGVNEVHFLGDFGFLWSNHQPAGSHKLRILNRIAAERDVTILVTGGNHENYDLVESYDPDADGVRWLGSNIGWLPRGWRTTRAGRTVASLGGANSIDRYQRRPGHGWWAQEQITEADLEALGHEPVDILLAHDAPQSVALRARLLRNQHLWDARGLAYADMGQQMFQRGLAQVRPQLTIGGHYHLSLDVTEEFELADGETFTTRSVILHEGRAGTYFAVVDAATLEVEPMRVRRESHRLQELPG